MYHMSIMIHGARILSLSHQSGSHMIVNDATLEELPKRGHEVYVALGSSTKEKPSIKEKGFKVLRFNHPGKAEPILDMDHHVDIQMESLFKGKLDLTTATLYAFRECELIMGDEAFMNEVKKLQFDLVLVDSFLISHCLEMIPYYLGIPFIGVTPVVEESVTRIPQPASFVPAVILEATGRMSFSERLKTFIVGSTTAIPYLSPFTAMRDVTLLKKYIQDPEIQDWTDLAMKVSLTFVTVGPIAEPPAPTMPNVVLLEALTASPAKPLDKMFLDYINSAIHGVVVVSFGSSVRKMPEDILQKLFDACAQRKELFIWRMEIKDDSKLVISSNVKLFKWLPQNDILGHPKTRLFITHSGNNGRYEALYHGVPMIALPMFGDQPHNALMIQEKGFGIAMKLFSFTSKEVVTNMRKILDDSNKYHKATERASKLLKSKPMNAHEEAAYWIEHVLEFGDEHLRSTALSMPYYQYAMWDIYGFIMLSLNVTLKKLYIIYNVTIKLNIMKP